MNDTPAGALIALIDELTRIIDLWPLPRTSLEVGELLGLIEAHRIATAHLRACRADDSGQAEVKTVRLRYAGHLPPILQGPIDDDDDKE